MTRASLLHLLAHPTALAGPDVRALEELAQAFPYCQTAHLLLAKAAHDQGSMLAAQRLRRAATYAADRTRLRQLIEATAEVAVAVGEEIAAHQLAAPVATEVSAVPVPESVEHYSDNLIEANEPVVFQANIALEDKPDQVIGTAEEIGAEPVADEGVSAPATTESLIESVAEAAPDTPAPTPLPEPELPAQAPPIRPPAEAGAARFEFGLADEEPAEIIAYRLPEWSEPLATPALAATPITPRLPAFSGVADVSYAPGEGSRLGFCLVVAGTAEAALPSASLPPAGEFFEPDALLLDYVATYEPPTPPKPSSLELINSFLQRAPVASRRRAMPTPAMPDKEAQADLSVRSTRAEPDLASESLAHILARQGKNERAIAVYERLMVKYPEKMAYFAAQIESLRPTA